MPLTHEFAAKFAEDWIASWNAHDLQRILDHYTDDFEMSSPFIISRNEDPTGTLVGKEAVGNYWRRALEANPTLHFELIEVLACQCEYFMHLLQFQTGYQSSGVVALQQGERLNLKSERVLQ